MISALLLLAATYANPVLHMDFSDPDICIGADARAYLTASSFGAHPALPVLVSDDLVNWRYVSHALESLPYATETPEHGNAIWAPSIRYRADREEYVIYWGDPDRGIYRVAAKSPEGPWGAPRLVVGGKGLIDPCPLYDEDGRIYLVNAWAASRAHLNSVLTVRELDQEETHAVSAPVMVYDGVTEGNFTTEGPKLYKKDGEYWLFFPAGGVGGGWQVAARAKSVYGPYTAKTVLAQGKSAINGPHQGAVVEMKSPGEAGKSAWWFLHFSDREAYGRVVYLEPMTWAKGEWPVIGKDGEPVAEGTFEPACEAALEPPQRKFAGLAVSDEFDTPYLAPQWEFLGVSSDRAAWPTPYGYFRLYTTAARTDDSSKASGLFSAARRATPNLWRTPNLMVQKFPAARFTATLKARMGAKAAGEEAGLVVMGRSYARIGLRYRERAGKEGVAAEKRFELVYVTCAQADCGGTETEPRVLATFPATVVEAGLNPVQTADVYLRLQVRAAAEKTRDDQLCPPPLCTFGWSRDGETFHTLETPFEAAPGKWIGARFGLYALHERVAKPFGKSPDRGWLDADYLRVE